MQNQTPSARQAAAPLGPAYVPPAARPAVVSPPPTSATRNPDAARSHLARDLKVTAFAGLLGVGASHVSGKSKLVGGAIGVALGLIFTSFWGR